MRKPSLHAICHALLSVFALACSFLVFVYNLLYLSQVSYDRNEKVLISDYPAHKHWLVFIILLVLFFIFIRSKNHKPINTKKLFISLSVFYIICGIYLIAFSDHSIRADAQFTYSAAQSILKQDYSPLKIGNYIHTYPHQLGLMLYDQILFSIIPNPAFNFFVNLLWVLGINCVIWKISSVLFDDPAIHQLTILLSFGFLPQFFYIMFAYSLIPGFFFMLLSFYHTLVFCRTHRPTNILFFLLFAAISVILKKNFLIGIIAEVLYLFLHLLKTKNWHVILIFPLLVCVTQAPSLVIHHYEDLSGLKVDNPAPSILHIVMGTDIDNNTLGPGWYHHKTHTIYSESGYQTDAAASAGRERLSENIAKIRSRSHDARTFFEHKTISQWCEPLYQSLWSGPLADVGQHTHTLFLQSLYNDDVVEDIIMHYCKALTTLIWGFALYFLCILKRRVQGWELPFIYFIGGFLFHTFWEAKSQYIYPYVFCLIPFIAYSIHHFFQCTICFGCSLASYKHTISQRINRIDS